MLRIYWSELKKLRRQKLARTLFVISFLMPAFSTALCVNNHYPFRNLIGANVLFGSFLVAPFLFSIQLLSLFEQEQRNYTLKNILVIGISKEKIFFSKIMVSLTIVLLFTVINTVYSIAGGLLLRNYSPDFLVVFRILLVTSMAAVSSTMPVVILIIMFQYRNLIAMIIVNCFVLLDFLFVWQLTMMNLLNFHLPILVAYRITYPISIIDYTENLQQGMDTLYYPLGKGIFILILTDVISLAVSMRIFRRQNL